MPAHDPVNVLVVIVNYRSADLTIDCLRSLAGERGGGVDFRVVVTDNASGDDSAARIAAAVRDEGFDGWAEVRPLAANGGFAAGNNAAIRPALESGDPPDYVLLLNPDTVVREGALRALVEFLERHPGVGIAGARLEDPDGTSQRSAFRFPTALGELESTLRLGPATKLLAPWVIAPPVPPEACPADWVAGACMLVRRAVFDAVGVLDEGYFMYYEEVDFCHRARRAGWPCWYVPEARVVHLVGQSSGVTDPRRARARRPAYWFRARRRYFVANCGRARARLADAAWMLGLALYRLRRAIDRRPDADPSHLVRDFVRNSFAGTRA